MCIGDDAVEQNLNSSRDDAETLNKRERRFGNVQNLDEMMRRNARPVSWSSVIDGLKKVWNRRKEKDELVSSRNTYPSGWRKLHPLFFYDSQER